MPIPWASIIGAGLGGLGSLFGGRDEPEWLQIPGAPGEIQQMRDAGNWAYENRGSRGSKFANWWLAQLLGKKGGDPAALLNMSPFKARHAAELDDVRRESDMSMALESGANPHLALRASQINQERAKQRQGAELEGWVHGMTGQAMNVSQQAKQAGLDNRMQAENAALAAFINSHALPGGGGGGSQPGWKRYLFGEGQG